MTIPRTGVSMLVQDAGKVLLIKRGKAPYKGCWSLPGGAQEFGETLEECGIREMKEETNLDVADLKFLTIRDRLSRHENGELNYHYVLATFLAKTVSGTPVAGDDAQDIGWFSLEEIEELETTPELVRLLSNFLGN